MEMLCRVCLQGGQENEFVSLFDTDENNELLGDKYFYCSDIKVTDNEIIPSNICLTCVDRLLSAYQFKQQCISSNDTLKKCFSEIKISSNDLDSTPKTAGTEYVTIKDENGGYVRYEIPIEYETPDKWPNSRNAKKITKSRRGRPRKYPDAMGRIEISPYSRKNVKTVTKEYFQNVIAKKDSNQAINFGNELGNMDENTQENNDSDAIVHLTLDPVDGSLFPTVTVPSSSITTSNTTAGVTLETADKSKNKTPTIQFDNFKLDDSEKDEEDVLLKETILASSEPIPRDLLNSQIKEKKKPPKKIYKYDKVHTCDQCGSSFRSNASLQAHIRRHLGIKPFVCKVCGYASVLNMELRRHMMRHTGHKPYKCRYCVRFFGDFGSRQKHERLHLGERPYQCSVCAKSFTYSYVLSNHMLTHTGEKKYSCGPCNKKFTKAHHLKYHNKIHHKDLFSEQEDLKKEKTSPVNVDQHVLIINQNPETGIEIQDVRTVSNFLGSNDLQIIEFNEDNMKCEPVKTEHEL